jgi:hypothetical protein
LDFGSVQFLADPYVFVKATVAAWGWICGTETNLFVFQMMNVPSAAAEPAFAISLIRSGKRGEATLELQNCFASAQAQLKDRSQGGHQINQCARRTRIKSTTPIKILMTVTPPRKSNLASGVRFMGNTDVNKSWKPLRLALPETDFTISCFDIKTGILWSRAPEKSMGCFPHANPDGLTPIPDNNRHIFQTVGPHCCAAIMPGGGNAAPPIIALLVSGKWSDRNWSVKS